MKYNTDDRVKLKEKYDDDAKNVHLSKGAKGTVRGRDIESEIYKVKFDASSKLIFLKENKLDPA